MSNIYKVTLSPLEWYFFGGETTFGEGESNNYFAKSNLLPQETSLLGMLRYELLKAENLLPITQSNKKRATDLIGEKSFNYNGENRGQQSFGAIYSISPVFIQHGKDDILYKAPMDYKQNVEFAENPNKIRICFTNRCANKQTPIVNNFLAKKYATDIWISLLNDKEHKEFSKEKYEKDILLNDEKCNEPNKQKDEKGIFCQKTKIGITKRENERKSVEGGKDGFFKTTLCTLNPEYSFVFFVHLGTDKLEGNRLVHLGAERSMFNMRVEKSTQTFERIKQQIPVFGQRLVFISDAFVNNEVLSYCKFGWTETVPFRNLVRTNEENKNYAKLDKIEKSNRFNLIKRGSVLFFDNENLKKITSLVDDAYLQSFGYNQYVINTEYNKKYNENETGND